MQIRKGRSLRKSAGITVVLLAVVALLFAGIWHEAALDRAQRELLAVLETNAGNYNEDRVVLSSTNRREAREMTEAFGGTLRITDDGRFAVINLPDGITLADIAQNGRYRKYHDRILLDYRNFSAADEDVTDDTLIRSAYQIEDPMYAQQMHIDYLNIGETWDLTRGKDSSGDKVTVAIIDTGIDTDHPEFYDANGNSIISTQSYDATNDKVVDQYDISVIKDCDGHGTAVAGIIAAQMNDEGIVGIAPDVELLVIKCETDEAGEFKSSADIVFAIYYAIEMDVDVINLSLGGSGGKDMHDALQLAVDSDIVCVAAAGNDATKRSHFPAAYDIVIGVGALTGGSWELADYSNYGVNSDIVAPGSALTTAVGGSYTYRGGTSIAAPMVTAAVALYKSQNPYATYEEIKADLLAAGRDLGDAGEDDFYSFGALDINAFVCEEKGIITYDYCTQEIETTTQVFVRQHTIQTVPEPERENIIFDDWYYDKAYTRVFDYDAWYSTEFVEDVTLYAKWVNEDDEGASVYNYKTLEDGTIEIVSYKGKRRYLTIPNEIDGKIVSSIGPGAFLNNTRLREVIFPEGLVFIKNNAFSGVSKMREVTFTGDQLLQIQNYAFYSCKSLQKLEVPDSVEFIGERAFNGCSALRSVAVSENSCLHTLGDFAFSDTAVVSFYIPQNVTADGFNGTVLSGATGMRVVSVHSGNSAFMVSGGTLYNTEKTKIIYYPAARTGDYTVADGVVSIGRYAFCRSSISGIELNAVVTIEESAFENTKLLASVVLPDTVTNMGVSAFEGSSITTVNLSKNLTMISSRAFAGSRIGSVHIPAKVQLIGSSAFAYCNYLKTLTFDDASALWRIQDNAFAYCGILENFELPESVTTIGRFAFDTCRSITSLSIPVNVSTIGVNAFQYCTMLRQVDFAEACALTTIPDGCFSGCTMLDTVHFSDGIVNLGQSAFRNDRELRTLNFGDGSTLTTVGDECFYSCAALQTMQLPDSVSKIGKFAYAFSGLEKADISANVTDIGAGAFGACYSLSRITVAEDNTAYIAVDNALFDRDITTVHCVPASRTGVYSLPDTVKITAPYSFYYDKFLTGVVLPDGMEDIQMNSFYNCNSLISIDIPANVTNIGRQAFENCYELASVTFGSDSRLERLGIYTFVNCGFSEITIPASVEEIAQYVFYNCNELKTITFEENSELTYIAAYLFKGTRVEHVVFGEGSALKSLQAHAFDGASWLVSVDFGDAQITNVDNYAFYRCYELKEISIPDTVTHIGRYAFYGCANIDRIDLPAATDYIGESAFYGTDNLRVFFDADELPANVQVGWDNGIAGYFLGAVDYVITDEWEYSIKRDGTIMLALYKGIDSELIIDTVDGYTVSGIGPRCFYRNQYLEEVSLSENITEIGNYAFCCCEGLTTLEVPASVKRIGKYAFADSSVCVTFADGTRLEVLDDYAFCGNATDTMTLPDTVTVIGEGAFQNSALTKLTITETSALKTIGQHAFVGCGVTDIYLPAALNTLGAEAFKDVISLNSVIIADGNTALKLSNGAFEGCGIIEITVPARVNYIGEYAFGRCQSLRDIHVDAANEAYTAIDGVLCDSSGTTLIQYPCGRGGPYEVPEQITVLTYSSFRDAKKLTEVTFAEGSTVQTIGWQTFSGCNSLTSITVPDSIVSFDFYAFENCTALTSVILGEGSLLTGVYEGAFYNCIALADIALPDTVVEISEYAFYNCESLPAVPLTEDACVKGIYDYAFYGCTDITQIPVFAQLVEIGEYAFAYTGIEEYTVAASVKDIAGNAFVGCEQFAVIHCDGANEEYAVIDGALYEKNAGGTVQMDGLVIWPYGKVWLIGEGKTVVTSEDTGIVRINPNIRFALADTVTTLSNGAFFGCGGLTHIVIPEQVTNIGKNVFAGCPGLVTAGPVGGGYNIEFEWTEEIPVNAFRGCYNLNKVTLPETLKVIREYAFYDCHGLGSLVIPKNVSSIEAYALYDCKAVYFEADMLPPLRGEYWINGYRCNYYLGAKGLLRENDITFLIRFDDTASAIGYSGEDPIVVIPSSVGGYPVREIGGNLLEKRLPLLERYAGVWVPKSVRKIDESAFRYKEIAIMMEADRAPVGAVGYWSEECEVIYGATEYGMTGYGQFYCISGNQEVAVGRYRGETPVVNIPGRIKGLPVTKILAYAFADSTSLEKVSIPETVTSIGESAFYYCKSLSEITFPEGLTNLGRFAFRFCSSLNSVDIPDNITVLHQSVFDDCTNLKTVKLPDRLEKIDNYVFMGCESLCSIVIPKSVVDIGYHAFDDCKSLKTVYIDSPDIAACLTAGEDALCICDYAETVSFAADITQVGDYVAENYPMTEQFERSGTSYVAYSKHPHVWQQTQHTEYIECAQDGYDESVCMQCALEKNTTIPAHDMIEMVEQEAMCFAPGLEKQTCSRCGYEQSSEIPAVGRHSMSPWYTVEEAGDDSPGLSRRDCDRCGSCETGAFTTVDSGSCGDRAEWVLTGTGELKITGSGRMEDGTQPWSAYEEQIRTVEIGSGITSISSRAFTDYANLTSVVIPDGVVSIGYAAFNMCKNLAEINIPDSVTDIGGYCFQSTSLTSVVIPDRVRSIGSNAFAGCSALKEVTLSDSLEKIESAVFSGCISLESITIPESVTIIDRSAFANCRALTGIVIPKSVDSIGQYAFDRCSSLVCIQAAEENPVFSTIDGVLFNKDATILKIYPAGLSGAYQIPDGVRNIAEYAFYGCTGLTDLCIPDTVMGIGSYAFEYCTGLKELVFPNSVVAVGSYAFGYCSGLESVTLSDSMITISDGIFQECNALTSVTIPASITKVGNYAFYRCTALQHIYLQDVVAWLSISYSEHSSSILGCNGLDKTLYLNGEAITELDIPDTVTEISKSAFSHCSGLTRITIPSSVTRIGNSAFSDCTGLTEIGIPDSVTIIGNSAFAGCSNLSSITIPDGVTTIGNGAFHDCISLTSIEIPGSVTSIDRFAFHNCEGLTEVVIHDGVEFIGGYAFSGCSALSRITIPNGITSIEDGTFNYCTSLTAIAIPDSVTDIGSSAFYKCTGLTCVEIPGNVTAIGDNAFYGCSGLTGVIIPESVTSIGKSAFSGCTGLTGIVIPASVTSLGDSVFRSCSNLATVELAGPVASIGSYAFYECSSLSGITFHGGVGSIGGNAFAYCTGLTDIAIPDGTSSIGGYAFQKCTGLTNVTIPDSVTAIGTSAFSSCSSLSEVTIPSGVVSVGQSAFANCSAIAKVTIYGNNVSIGADAFNGCKSLVDVKLLGSVSSIGHRVFSNCGNPLCVTFECNAPTFSNSAFSGRNVFAYYPAGNETWTTDVRQNYGGTVTWLAVCDAHEWDAWTITAASTCMEAGTERRDCVNCDMFETREIPALGHSYESVATAPTCTEQGFVTHTCTNCGDSYLDTYVDALGHDMGAWTTAAEATCTEDGSERRDCSRCDHYESRTINAIGHTFGAWFVSRNATCTENGEYRRDCVNCSHYETEVIPAIGHSYESVVTAPTCTEKGFITHICTKCGDSYADTYVDALGHDMGKWTVVTEVTCTTNGSERRDCSRCEHYETRVVNATGHSFGAWFENRSATCTENGENRRNCSVCGHYETEVIPTTGHDYESVVTAPTCTEQGYTTHACAKCGDSYVDTYVDAQGHDMSEWTTIKEATCTEDGSERRDCSRCDHYETRVIDAAGHNYEAVVTAPTCTERGFTTHICTYCGDTYVDTYVDALGHDMGKWTVVTEVTCTTDGSERRDCSRCDHYETRVVNATGHSFGAWFVSRNAICTEDGEYRRDCGNCSHYETEVIPATGHNYESVVKAPTCTEQGHTTHTCNACGDSYIDTYVDALDHDWDDGVVTVEPTEESVGEMIYTCSRCGETRIEIIPELEHEHRYHAVVTEPTCSNQGYTTHTCRCGDSYVDTYVNALGHDMGEWTTVTEATCTADGSERRDCSRCDHYETRTIKATGHSFGAWFVNRSATCTEDGENRRNCSNCSHYEMEVIPATGHDYESVVTDPTCTEQGFTTHTCSVCGDSYVDSYVDALGHDMGDWIVVTEATCTEIGEQIRVCSHCEHLETRDIEALGHDWDDGVVTVEPTEETQGEMTYTCRTCAETRTEVIPELGHEHRYEAVITYPTCTEQGFTTHTCRCGDSYVDSYVDALGHDMGEWFTVTEATCTADGMEQSDCSRCDYHETQIIEAAGHDYESVVTEPTCTAQGFTTHICHCGDSYTDSYTAALGHSFTEYVSDGNATCIQDGTKTAVCDRCVATDTVIDEGSAHGHDFTDWTVIRKPTETAEGLESRYCLHCGVEETRTIARLENPFGDVPSESFYYEPVMWAVENGITNGTSATTFGPNDQCMRAHVVTFLWRAVGSPEPTRTDNPFVDVKSSDFYYKAVMWALENGITSGMDATHFGPTAYCNRAQVVTFLYRTMGSPEVESTTNPFMDVAEGSFYEKAVLWAVENGITNGLSATAFGPNAICNRAQIVTFLYRAFVTE